MSPKISKSVLLPVLKEANEVFRFCSKKLKILSTLSWGGDVAAEFFKKKEAVAPTPVYKVDKPLLTQIQSALTGLEPRLQGEHPVLAWLRKTRESYFQGAELLLEIGTDRFYDISTGLYGNPATKPFGGNASNLDLANWISTRMAVCTLGDISETPSIESVDFSSAVEARLKTRNPSLPVRIELTDDISAKVVAGMNRVRIRRNARFSKLELSALWNHEIESHALTANNGVIQEPLDFLCSGGPRTTMTQEGLAVFFEMYGHSMSQRRFLALCDRVHAVKLVEDGAGFIDLYRWYKERSDNNMEAFFAASRIFRGSQVQGRKPFTKDVVYLAGLLGIFNFLQVAVKNQNRLLVESLICGRISLEDVAVIAWLRTHGIVQPPRFTPTWLDNWEALLSFFSFSAFVNGIDLSSYRQYLDTHSSLQDWDFSL